jgi:hypothetical protein
MSRTTIPALCLLILTTGCSSGPGVACFEGISDATGKMCRAWSRVTEAPDGSNIPRWDWASAVPADATRAEIIRPCVRHDALVHFAPDFRREPIQLASTADTDPSYRIINVEGTEVSNYAELNMALEKAMAKSGKVQFDVVNAHVPNNGPAAAVVVDPHTLIAVTQSIAPEQKVVRIADHGNPWMVIRDDGVRCKLMARVERGRGLLQVVMSLVTCWGDEILLPVEVRAFCNDHPLRCLSAADTLELLYGRPQWLDKQTEEVDCSFAAVSEADGYLIPTNYKRLYEETAIAFRRTTSPPPPALISVPGVSYPGPAILGDARSLTGIMLQRQLFQPGGSEQTGWIMFADPALRRGGKVEVEVDLGHGPVKLAFSVPAPETSRN